MTTPTESSRRRSASRMKKATLGRAVTRDAAVAGSSGLSIEDDRLVRDEDSFI